MYQRRTHNRSQRFGGHTKHTYYCSCGRQVNGNGGQRHFELEGHRRILQRQWYEQFGPSAAYSEGWRGRVYSWLGRRVELLARRVPYRRTGRFDLRYHVLDPLSDRLVFAAMRRGWRHRAR